MKEIELKAVLTLKGPVITAASEAGVFGVDMPFARNAQGRYYLPGTHVKGLLLENLEKFADVLGLEKSEIEEWFGVGSRAGSNDRPLRGSFLFGDFAADKDVSDAIRTRIRIDEARGAVAKGAYLAMESPFESGEDAVFSGTVRFAARNGEEKRIRKIVEQGLRLTPAFGGQRSVGFGKTAGVQVRIESAVSFPTAIGQETSGKPLTLRIKPLTPFCVARGKKAKNLFESDTVLSGATIKGCVAATLNYMVGRPLGQPADESLPAPWTELGRHLSRIRFVHAFPSEEKNLDRSRNYPLSLVRAPAKHGSREKETYDAILCPGPGLINGEAPAFCADWKTSDRTAVNEAMGWTEPGRKVLRVRTRMDLDTRRSRDEALFAYEMVDPRGFVWIGRADFESVPESDRARTRSALEALMEFGLRFLGKTKADADVETGEAETEEVPPPVDGNKWAVTLQTPAPMVSAGDLSPDALADDVLADTDISGDDASGGAPAAKGILFTAYDNFWDNISGGALSLVRFFAEQRLEGGYLHKRFQGHRPYNPFVLTAERSVFLLKSKAGRETDACDALKDWVRNGLPLDERIFSEYEKDGKVTWRQCPYVKENGFGEIAVNMPCHAKLDPRGRGYEEV